MPKNDIPSMVGAFAFFANLTLLDRLERLLADWLEADGELTYSGFPRTAHRSLQEARAALWAGESDAYAVYERSATAGDALPTVHRASLAHVRA